MSKREGDGAYCISVAVALFTVSPLLGRALYRALGEDGWSLAVGFCAIAACWLLSLLAAMVGVGLFKSNTTRRSLQLRRPANDQDAAND